MEAEDRFGRGLDELLRDLGSARASVETALLRAPGLDVEQVYRMAETLSARARDVRAAVGDGEGRGVEP